VRLVVVDGLHPVFAGLVVGLTAAAVLRISLNRFVRQLPEFDASLLVLVPLLFVAAGALACYLPARRAACVDPSVVLRDL
jgi:ABC-type lipoprotein release transport system permease subunit